MPVTESDQRGDADSTKSPSLANKPRAPPFKRAQSPLPWFQRPNPPNKHHGLNFTGGHLHHPHRASEVPYPYTFSNPIIEQEILSDYMRNVFTRLENSFLDLQNVQPRRTLDVGCGQGFWVVATAQKWQNTEFVGFDISPIQTSLDELDEACSSRISWVHGNFLKPWPFEDNSFDHVRIRNIGSSVPEPMWPFVIGEIRRVLTVGGRYEWNEEDITFPHEVTDQPAEDNIYPSRSGSPDSAASSSSSGSRPPSSLGLPFGAPYQPSPLEYDPDAGYDDQVIEALYLRIFQDRNINPKPTTQIPLHLNSYFNGNLILDRSRIPVPPKTNAVSSVDRKGKGRQVGNSHTPRSSSTGPASFVIRYHIDSIPDALAMHPIPLSDLESHYKLAVETVMAAQEAIWEWIVNEENWQAVIGENMEDDVRLPIVTSRRHPVVETARADLEYAFKVFHSRLDRFNRFSDLIPRLDFESDDLAHAFDGDQNEDDSEVESRGGAGSNARSLKSQSDHPSFDAEEQARTSSPLHFDAPWLSLKDPEIIFSFTSDSAPPRERHPRTSSELPLSYLTKAITGALGSGPAANGMAPSRSRTASAPELSGHLNSERSRNGNWTVPCSLPAIADVDTDTPPNRTHCPLEGSPQNVIAINGPDAEQTVPFASRVVRFFTGVKGPED